MSHSKQPERRTFLQDRLEILIKRQRSGTASFNELTELDDIVNSNPEIRKQIILESFIMEEMDDLNNPSNPSEQKEIPFLKHRKHFALWNRLKLFLLRLFNSEIVGIKIKNNYGNGCLILV